MLRKRIKSLAPVSNARGATHKVAANYTLEIGGKPRQTRYLTLYFDCGIAVCPGSKPVLSFSVIPAGAHHLELINIIDKKRSPLNPNPGNGGPGEEFAQRGGKESLQFVFPFHVPNGRMRVDIPFAVMRPETDQLPGSCKNWMSVGRGIDIANNDHGIT
jgi:hypothetical protein